MAKLIRTSSSIEHLLSKTYKTDKGILMLSEIIAAMPDKPRKEIHNGLCGYNRHHFNRKNGAEQQAYMERLETKRIYTIDDMVVPKTIFDAVDGRLTYDVDGRAAA